jgi:manganese/zinc/iron transport system permease protein
MGGGMLALFSDLLFDYTLRTVALGSIFLGAVSGAFGAFAVLRRQSLLGDAMSHAALPGIVIAFLLTRSKEPLIMVIGAVIAGWAGTLVILRMTAGSRIKYDSALSLVLSVFFGLGLVLLTYTQRLPDARQAGLDKFLFGQAATMLTRDVLTIAVLGGISMILLALFWKEFKILSFDPGFATSLGFPVRGLDILLTTLLVVAIMIGLQAVGVVLMSAMIVAPAVAARQWTDRLDRMVMLSAFLGALAGLSGTLISSLLAGFSTGPTIVLCASVIVFISILFAPNRGLVPNSISKMVRAWQFRRKLAPGIPTEPQSPLPWAVEASQQKEQLLPETLTVLESLFRLAQQHNDSGHPHHLLVLRAMNPDPDGVKSNLKLLQMQGWVRQKPGGKWFLTTAGLEAAQRFFMNEGDEVLL